MEVAIEIKSSQRVHETAVKSLVKLSEEHQAQRLILISNETEPKRLLEKVECLPWRHFLTMLWGGEII